MTYGWNTSMRDLTHPPGTLVAKPAYPRLCWGTCGVEGRLQLRNPRGCRRHHRGGQLTCKSHANLEGKAVALHDLLALKAQTDPEVPSGK